MKRTSIVLPDEMLAWLQGQARKNQRSLSGEIRWLVEAAIEAERKGK